MDTDSLLHLVYIVSSAIVFATAAATLHDYSPRAGRGVWPHVYRLALSLIGAAALAGGYQALTAYVSGDDAPWKAHVVLMAALAVAGVAKAPCSWTRWIAHGEAR